MSKSQVPPQTTATASAATTAPVYMTTSSIPTAMQGGSASRFPKGWDPTTGYGMHPDFFTTPVKGQFNTSASQPMTSQPDPSATRSMGTQQDASTPPPMNPQQRLAILLQPQSPSKVLILQSPHQKGVNWVFHNQATGQIWCVSIPYMNSTDQQSASPSVPQPTMSQQTPDRMAQQAHQMPLAGLPMMPTSPQPAMMMNSANMASPQQMPAADQQVDWNSKIAEVMREQFGLRPKQQSVMYKTPYPPAYN